jgi:hypothetical protein
MYVISADPAPIKLLLNDLSEALDRGVSVEIYLNTQFQTTDTQKLTEPLKGLEQKGARIYLASPRHKLHDKLIIVDGRYVVEGSTNWSISALKVNYESATIIDSPALALEKTVRVRNIIRPKDRPDRPKVKEPLPDTIELPKAIVEDERFFARMRSHGSDRAINAYLLLIAESARLNKNEFFLELEDFAGELRMPQNWSDTAKRRQVIKTLKKLTDKYKLIKVIFTHGKDAYITLIDLGGGTFTAPSSVFDPDLLAKTSPTAKTVILIDTLLKDEGRTRDDFSKEELIKRFHTTPRQFRKAGREVGGLSFP